MSLPTQAVHQGRLEKVIKSLFPNERYYLEVDLWIPSLCLCFEFQDPYHYTHTWDSNVPIDLIQEKDRLKQESIIKRGETLVLVPFWWDGKSESLKATINFERPEFISDKEHKEKIGKKEDKEEEIEKKEEIEKEKKEEIPINLNPPRKFFEISEGTIPIIGELMLASFPSSIHFINTVDNDNPWWMGEKYDGYRCCYVGPTKQLFSRSGKEINLPDSFMDKLLKYSFFDAEIWLGRGHYAETQLINSWSNETLSFLRIVSFDDPNPRTQFLPFEERYEHLLLSIILSHPFLTIAPRVLCDNKKFLSQKTQDIIKDTGEGVILRAPNSTYVPGRSTSLVKFKASRADKEALVVKLYDNSNDVLLLLPDGSTTFTVDSNGANLQTGDIVTFSYESVSSRALPVNPQITRIRNDKSWKELVLEYNSENNENENNEIKNSLHNYMGRDPKPMNYWTANDRRNMRSVFLNFSKQKNFEPLLAKNWYPISKLMFKRNKDAQSIFANFGGSFIKALMTIFPEIGLEENKFIYVRRKYWLDVKNRRNFYLKFAQQRGFDPFVAENWSKYNADHVMAAKGAGLLGYYGGSYALSLIHLFPEINLELKHRKITWRLRSFRRNFFEKFAAKLGINPLKAEQWYTIPIEKLESSKSAVTISKLFKRSVPKAIIDSFPEINIDERRFTHITSPYWSGKTRKNFFLAYARKNSFDPLIAKNWYSVSVENILKFQGAGSVLAYYKGSLMKALLHLFPDIGLDLHHFKLVPRNYWHDMKNRRNFFLNFAKSSNFNPTVAENWYKVTQQDLISHKGALGISNYYEGSLAKAIVHLFPELNLQKSKFTHLINQKFRLLADRRNFLISLSQLLNFDPLVPSNWYNLTPPLKVKDLPTLLTFYKGNFGKMVMHSFPEINFDLSKFKFNSLKKLSGNIPS